MAFNSASFDPALIAQNSDAASSAFAEADAASAAAAAASSKIAAQSAAWEAAPIRGVVVKCIADDTALTVADGKAHFTVPIEFNGMNLVSVGAHVYTPSTSGLPTFQIHNLTDAQDMLSTVITIDENEKDSKDATTPAVINTTYDDVATGDELRFDCDSSGTGTKGMEIRMGWQLP